MAHAFLPSPATATESSLGDSAASKRGRLAQWILLPLLWIAVIFISVAQGQAARDADFEIAVQLAALDWAPWILLSPLVVGLARRVQIDGRNWRRTVPIHAVAAILVAWLTVELGDYAISCGWIVLPERGGPARGAETNRTQSEGTPPRRNADDRGTPRGPPRFIRARISIPIYCVLVAAVHAIIYHRRSLERERQALTAEARLVEARLIALQTQLNPHFLFNTLNAISGMVYTDPRAADDMICGLSGLFRRVLEISAHKEVRLGDELEFLDRYLAIQLIRFSDRLKVVREMPGELADAMVPTLILQPLVENALVHGISAQTSAGTVTIRAIRRGERLVLTVTDRTDVTPERRPKQSGSQEGTGLSNTRARLAALYGQEAHLRLEAEPDGGTSAVIELPLKFSQVP